MEIFIDGGLFELLIAVVLGNLINFIFHKKYLLIIYSFATIISPALTFFLNKGEIFYFLVSFSLVNSILLVILLWKQRQRSPVQPPLDIAKFKKRFFNNFRKKKLEATNTLEEH